MRAALTAAFVMALLSAQGQEHPIISHYALTELDGAIAVDWTIRGGSTCDGQQVERSTDGITFVAVHRISGICGDGSVPVEYHWIDNDPPEFTEVRYRIELGVQGHSSVMSVVFDQLTKSDQRFFPSPMHDQATLLLNVPRSSPVELRILDATGRLVLQRNVTFTGGIPITLPGAPAGIYTYVAQAGGRTFTGRFVKE
ncbi:MAG: T9SS type A sorting domain-containing protein [Flavobacteriales bacterium]|nr:T9SS type A sorting domain-containing protein [Flavobacteriales bacterium]